MSVTAPHYRLFPTSRSPPKDRFRTRDHLQPDLTPLLFRAIRAQVVVHAGVSLLSEIKSRVGTLDNALPQEPIPPTFVALRARIR